MRQDGVAAIDGVVGRAVSHIREQIAQGLYGPGQRLIEGDLGAELQISRAALREALHKLAAEGVLELERYKGASVRRLDRGAVAEMFEVRALLEGLAARRAALAINENLASKAEIGSILDELEAAGTGSDPSKAYALANARLHGFVLEQAGGHTLTRLVPPLQMPLFRLVLARLLDAPARAASQAGHRVIVAALLAGDAATAEIAMRGHVMQSAAAVLALPDRYFG